MALSNDLISQFVKVTNDTKPKKGETTVYGTAVKRGDKMYVKLDGSDLLTPVSTTTEILEDDRVAVTLKDHSAVVTGNLSSPAVRVGTVQEIEGKLSVSIEELDTNKLSANQADIKYATIDNLEAAKADITKINADYINVDKTLKANEADIEKLKTDKLDAEDADIKYATIERLEADLADIDVLEADYADFKTATAENFSATNAEIEKLDAKIITTESLDANYANIDFANIGEAAIKRIFSDTGLIKDLVVGDHTVTGQFVGVTISGDLIEGNTVKADKLVVLGSDGIYYKLNVESGNFTGGEAVPTDSLHGSVITANSITAEKVNVKDLVAFGATIGNFKIDENAIYSGVKESVSNTTNGIYLGSDGQFAVGGTANFIKFFKDTDGVYKLEVAADKITLGSSGKNVSQALDDVSQDIKNITVGGRNFAENTNDEWQDTHVYQWSGGIGYRVNGTEREGQLVSFEEIGLNVGDDYTIGIDLNAINKPIKLRVDLYRTNTLGTNYNLYGTEVVEAGTSKRVYYTKTVTEEFPYFAIYIGNDDTTDARDTVEQYKCLKIEKGNKPTDWTPAPEDAAAAMEEIRKQANQNAADMADIVTDFNNDIVNLQSQIDGSITTWFYDTEPTVDNQPASDWTTTDLKNLHLGDLYYNTVTGYCYRWQVVDNNYSWQRITDTDVTKALSDAQSAKDTADQKRRVFYSQPAPPYDMGDLWVQGSAGDILRCQTAKTSGQSFSSSDWVLASKYTDDTKANAAMAQIQIEKDSILSTVGGITVGGRNLAEKTQDEWVDTTVGQWSGGIDYQVNGSDRRGQLVSFDEIGLNVGDDYTIGIDLNAINKPIKLRVDLYYNSSLGVSGSYASFSTEAIEVDTSKRVYYTNTVTEEFPYFAIYIGNNDTSDASETNEQYKRLKIEKGNKPTDWSPAPEDVQSAIIQLKDRIGQLVRDGDSGSLFGQDEDGTYYINLNGIEDAISNAATSSELQGVVTDINGNIDLLRSSYDTLSKFTEYIRQYTDENGQPCIELGEADSDFKVKITNTDIKFEENGDVPAKINRNMLIIDNTIVNDKLQFGDDEEVTGVWVWKRRSNGNLGLTWRGD